MASENASPAQQGRRVVESGYDSIGAKYASERRLGTREIALLRQFTDRVPAGGHVLDAGCGAGVPVAEWLSQSFAVTGVDISARQIELARERVAGARFVRADMTDLDFPDGSFDGICSFYAIIHVPREAHEQILTTFRRMLRPGGVVLLCLGAGDLKDDFDEFLGTPMYWSHYDAETNLAMLRTAGFEVLHAERVPDNLAADDGPKHLFVLARVKGGQ